MQRASRRVNFGPPPSAGPEPPASVGRNTGEAAPGPRGLQAHNSLRVLLVEDSSLLVQRIRDLLQDLAGVELVGTAATESDALELIEAREIDAVILDLQLHSGSGFGILRALRRRPRRPSVIVFTNFAIAACRDTALALGAQHFLDKSRDYDRLSGLLRELSASTH